MSTLLDHCNNVCRKFNNGDYDGAEAEFEYVKKLGVDDPWMWGAGGAVYFEKGKYKEVIDAMNNAIRKKPDDVYLYCLRGIAKIIEDRKEEGIADIKIARDKNLTIADEWLMCKRTQAQQRSNSDVLSAFETLDASGI